MSKIVFTVIFLFLTFSYSYGYSRSDQESFKQKCKRLRTPIYSSDATPQPYKMLETIEAGGTDFRYLYCRTRSKADELGADAIINFSVYLVDSGVFGSREGARVKFGARGGAVKWQ